MQITGKTLKPLTEAKYLNADNVSRYRAIMRIFWVTKLSWVFPNFNGVCPWGLIPISMKQWLFYGHCFFSMTGMPFVCGESPQGA